MKLFFDTSVLVAAMVANHPKHGLAFPWLQHAKDEAPFYLAAHTIAEIYAVLTTLPIKPRISPGTAKRLIEENILALAQPVALDVAEYLAVVLRMADLRIMGGAVYDSLIAEAARKVSADRLLTFNVRDFLRVWPEGKEIITDPGLTEPSSQ